MRQSLSQPPAYETKQQSVLEYDVLGRTCQFNQSDTSGETGSTLWLSAQILSEYLIATFGLGSKVRAYSLEPVTSTSPPTVLELGSGIGLTALVLQSLGFEVTATDTRAICDDFLKPNIMRNSTDDAQTSITVLQLDWFNWQHESVLDNSFDILVASDVVYEASLAPALCETIGKAAKKGTTVYIAQEVRDPGLFEAFVSNLKGLGLSGSRVSHAKLRRIMRDRGWSDEAWEGVVVWKFRRRSMKTD